MIHARADFIIIEKRRLTSPATTPQPLAWDSRNKRLWMGSRDLRRIYAIDPQNGAVLRQQDVPGIPWAAVAVNGELRFTIGEDPDDDRYIYRYTPENGFSKMFACPEFTGSYLSFDGKNLYMSQWYNKRVLKFDDQGNVICEINVGAEICGHTFANGSLYVLRGQEQPNKDWRIARVNPQDETPVAKDIAVVPFACRSLTFDGELFWSNARKTRSFHSLSRIETRGEPDWRLMAEGGLSGCEKRRLVDIGSKATRLALQPQSPKFPCNAARNSTLYINEEK
jgi:hypothetical protein